MPESTATNAVSYTTPWDTIKTAETRTVSDSRLKVIEAVTALGLDKLRNDPEAAARAIENHFGKILERQDNKEAVVTAAVEDLREQPPTEQEASSGEEQLHGPFMNRFERYAEEATTDDLRQKWGRVLASEIRKPGTFSSKAMRVIDELDPATATLFERVCVNRVNNILPKSTTGKLTLPDIIRLTEAGLLIEPGLGQVSKFQETTDNGGVELWFSYMGKFGISFPRIDIGTWPTNIIQKHEGKPSIPIYILTDVGFAISSILPDSELKALTNLCSKFAEAIDSSKIRKYTLMPNGQYAVIR